MNTSRTDASQRAFGKPALTGLLVFMLVLAALSSASHAMHGWLHQDHQSPSHSCLVTLLAQGQSDVAVTDTVALPCLSDFPAVPLPRTFSFIASEVVLFPERGPPRLS